MAAGTLDIIIDQGATWTLAVEWQAPAGTGINLTGYDVRAQVRDGYADAGGTVLASMTIGDGVTVTSAVGGAFTLSIPATDTETMPTGNYVWDCEVESAGGEVTRLLMGRAIIRPEVTR